MWPRNFLVVLATLTTLSVSLRIPIKRSSSKLRNSRLSTRATDLSKNQHAAVMRNTKDNIYAIKITIGGQDVTVHIDTGSADLWVRNSKIQTVQTTSAVGNLTYARGSVSGPIDFAPLEVAGFSIPSQAFINVNTAVDEEGLFATGASGLMGLGFDATGSVVHNLTLKASGPSDTKKGRSPISNIFYSNMSLPNFFTLLLGRTDDPDDEQAGVFTISEYIDEFSSVVNSPKMPSRTDDHWSVLLDSMKVGDKVLPASSVVDGIPSGKAVAVLDSGFSLPPIPPAYVDAIYAGLPGAVSVDDIPDFKQLGISYILPCDSMVDVSFKIGGVDFPVHPLDLTQVASDNKTVTFCHNAYTKFDLDPSDGFSGFDMILGDAFLRNSYTSFDYGSFNASGQLTEEPFMQLLPTTDATEARNEFGSVRTKQLQGLPKELSPSETRRILLGDTPRGSGAASLRGSCSTLLLFSATLLVFMWML